MDNIQSVNDAIANHSTAGFVNGGVPNVSNHAGSVNYADRESYVKDLKDACLQKDNLDAIVSVFKNILLKKLKEKHSDPKEIADYQDKILNRLSQFGNSQNPSASKKNPNGFFCSGDAADKKFDVLFKSIVMTGLFNKPGKATYKEALDILCNFELVKEALSASISQFQKREYGFDFEDAFIGKSDSYPMQMTQLDAYRLQLRPLAFEKTVIEDLLDIPKKQIKAFKNPAGTYTYFPSTGERFLKGSTSNLNLVGQTNETVYTHWIEGVHEGKKCLFAKVIAFAQAGSGMRVALYAFPGGRQDCGTMLVRYDSYEDFPHPNRVMKGGGKNSNLIPTPHFHFLNCKDSVLYVNAEGGSTDAISLDQYLAERAKAKDKDALKTLRGQERDISSAHMSSLSHAVNLIANVNLGGGGTGPDDVLSKMNEKIKMRQDGKLNPEEKKKLASGEFAAVNSMIDQMMGLEKTQEAEEFYDNILSDIKGKPAQARSKGPEQER